uniref:YDG domain-containing protein n=1 Tax=Oryza glumipatula TaxID=40148 RepID=A0A0E0BND9_9ORYZ
MENSEDEAENGKLPLELEPLRSLAPKFPTILGYDVETQSTNPLLVYATPFIPCSSSQQPQEAPASFSLPLPKSPVPIKATPISAAFPTPQHEDESSDQDYKPFCRQKKPTLPKRAKRPQQAEKSNDANIKRRSIRRSLDNEFNLCSSSSDNPKESVEGILMMFDSLRRRVLQLDEKEDASRRADLKAGTLMMQNNLRINNHKMIGHVPGVEVGDIFFFRIEMCIIGLHAPAMGGIDYISSKNKDETLAVCIISSGGYENDDDDTDILVYTGQGGNSRHKEKHDQKLERGNLALMNSKIKKNQIRVVRSAQDPFCNSGKIYIYDGLYRIEDTWTDTAKNGFNVFKYKLRRDPGQPDGISLWKMTEKWKANPATREKAILLDLSSKVEHLPVCLVNDVDDEKGPSHFNYVAGVKYLRPLRKTKPLQCCKCPSVCLPGDPNCSCAQQNGGDLPYSATGLVAKHTPMVYECSSNCQCSHNCRNRITQKGIKLNFEVFWTGDRGWGLRSWDPIRAGTFICEYAGEVIDETKMDIDVEEDKYTFRASCPGNKALSWNLGAELLEEKKVLPLALREYPSKLANSNHASVALIIVEDIKLLYEW